MRTAAQTNTQGILIMSLPSSLLFWRSSAVLLSILLLLTWPQPAHAQCSAAAASAYLFQFGSFGAGNGQLYNPVGVAVNAASNIIVADSLNNRIEVFDANGNYLSQFGSLGAGNGQFN